MSLNGRLQARTISLQSVRTIRFDAGSPFSLLSSLLLFARSTGAYVSERNQLRIGILALAAETTQKGHVQVCVLSAIQAPNRFPMLGPRMGPKA